jgi:hypothetical protein
MEPTTPEMPAAGDPYWDADHPQHKEAVARVSGTFRQALAPTPDTTRTPVDEPDEGLPREPQTPRAPAPEPYDLTAPPTLTNARDLVSDAGATAAEVGLSKAVAQELLTAYALDAEFPALPQYTGSPEAAETVLHAEWGADYEHRLALAQWAVKHSGERVQTALDQSGLGNNPAVVKFFARDGARAALDQIYAKRDHPLFDSSHREHKRALAQVKWLLEVAGR